MTETVEKDWNRLYRDFPTEDASVGVRLVATYGFIFGSRAIEAARARAMTRIRWRWRVHRLAIAVTDIL